MEILLRLLEEHDEHEEENDNGGTKILSLKLHPLSFYWEWPSVLGSCLTSLIPAEKVTNF